MADVGSAAPDFTLTGTLRLRGYRGIFGQLQREESSGDILSAGLLAGLFRTDSRF